MAQKVNPIAVRMKFNRFSDSSWFSDYYYSTLLYQDFHFRQYLNSIKPPNANKLGFRAARCIIHHFPKRSLIHLFCLSDPRPYQLEAAKNITPVGPRFAPFGGPTGRDRAKRINIGLSGLSGHNADAPRKVRSQWLAQPLSYADAPRVASVPKVAYNGAAGGRASNKGAQTLRASLSRVLETNFCVPEESPFWFNSSISQKKKALINLHRGVIENWTYLFFALCDCRFALLQAALPQFCCKQPSGEAWRAGLVFNGGTNRRGTGQTYRLDTARCAIADAPSLRGLFEALGFAPFWPHVRSTRVATKPANLYAGKARSNQAAEDMDHNTDWDCCCAPSSRPPAIGNISRVPAARLSGQLRSQNYYFNLYAMHYFFMQKTNNFYDKECFALLKQCPSTLPNADAPLTAHSSRFAPQLLSRASASVLTALNWLRASTEARSGQGSLDAVAPGSKSKHTYNGAQLSKSLDFYLSNVQFRLSQNTNTFISLRPIKISSVFQCASLVAQEIACKLEQKKSFRLICRLIFQQLALCKYIKGIRITCSGRLNGAEIAKTECRKNGETSLHVFSDKIDYARSEGKTPYGILGVKVWISYI